MLKKTSQEEVFGKNPAIENLKKNKPITVVMPTYKNRHTIVISDAFPAATRDNITPTKARILKKRVKELTILYIPGTNLNMRYNSFILAIILDLNFH
jgi:hypothetical protein